MIINKTIITFVLLITSLTSTLKLTNSLELEPTTYSYDELQHEDAHNNHLRTSFSDPKSVVTKTGGMCDGYNGILRVDTGDVHAASGTSFFVYVLNQIIYAEQNKLIPWVHFTNPYSVIYDGTVHDEAPTTVEGEQPVYFKTLMGVEAVDIVGRDDLECLDGQPYPGPPDYVNAEMKDVIARVETSGVWEHYFKPVSAFQPQVMKAYDVESCAMKPFINLHPHQIVPGLQLCSPYGLRSWQYGGIPKANAARDEPRSIHNWLGRMRAIANPLTTKYIHPQQWLIDEVDKWNPITPDAPPCLAMHIRHTDKGNGRVHVPLEIFETYARIFVDNGGESIYIATDQMHNIGTIDWDWPKEVSEKVRHQETSFVSNSRKAPFRRIPHHRANTEALVDIYAMSRCGLLVHGYSAMTEAVVYINGDLHERSVNLDDPEHIDEEGFGEMVRGVLGG